MKVGDRVALRDDECHGTVQELVDDDTVRVLLDGEENTEDFSSDELCSVRTLDEEFIELVNKKIGEAAKAIRDAADEAAKRGLDLLSTDREEDDDEYERRGEPLFNASQLKSAMGYAGWRTSSWNC